MPTMRSLSSYLCLFFLIISGFCGIHQVYGQIRLAPSLFEEVGMDSVMLVAGLDSIVKEGINQQAFPGCQVLVARKGRVVFQKAYGFHTYDSLRRVKLSDVYDLASVTKITGPLPILMKLHGEGKLDLEAGMGTYWPQLKGSNKENLPLRNVLAHDAGLIPYLVFWAETVNRKQKLRPKYWRREYSAKFPVKVYENLWLSQKYKDKLMYKLIKKSDVAEEKTYRYSGLSFLIYPDLIQRITAVPYEQYLQDSIFQPLGVRRMGYNPLSFSKKADIVPTEMDTYFRNDLVQGYVHDEAAAMLGGVSGNAGLFANAESLARLLQLYLDEGSVNGNSLISPWSIREFSRYQFPERGNRRGLGFDKPLLEEPEKGYAASDASPESYGHSGFTGTFVWIDPTYELVFVFLSNRVYPSRENRRLYNLSIRPSLHQQVYKAIQVEDTTE
ncbi:MAG: serine hydrolase domain-containing protein [Bacteroidota bacterium]